MIFDPLTIASNALVALLQADAALSSFNWKPWDDNNPHQNLPRGFVNVSARSALDDAWMPNAFNFEVIIEAKPQVDLDANKMANLLAQITRLDLSSTLNALVTDGSLTFEGIAESLDLSRVLVGETRQYKMGFTLHGQWQVVHV